MAITSKLARKEKRKCNKFKDAHPEMADEYYDDDDDKAEKVHRDMLNSDDSMLLSDQSIDDSFSLQNRYKYPELCKALERCKISNREACIIGIQY